MPFLRQIKYKLGISEEDSENFLTTIFYNMTHEENI
jgi:hypothetical protein